MDHRIAIVGAGISGLALLHELRRRGADAVVLEAAEEPGGVIRSVRREGRLLDLGPQRTRLVLPVERLVEELGLGDDLLRAPAGLPLFIWRGRRLREVPRSLPELVKTDLLSPAAKLRVLAEPFTGPPRPGESAGEYFRRSFGGEAYRVLLGPLFGGIYGSDPDDMPLRHSLAELLEDFGVRRSMLAAFLRRWKRGSEAPAAVSFRDGMQALPRALAGAHADRVRLSAPVTGVERRPGGWELRTPAGRVAAERVVLACPADRAATLVRTAAPEASDRLDRLAYNRLAVVHLRSEARLEGYGFQVAFCEDLAIRGVTWNASLFGRDGVYTAYLGGARDLDALARPDAELGERTAREFETVTGRPTEPLLVSRARIPAFDRSWDALDGLALPEGLRLCANYLSRPGITGRLRQAARLARDLASGE